MPILLGFLASEKVIFEKETNAVSIISVLHDVFIPVIRSVQVPPNTLVPLVWAGFTMWYWEQRDENVWYEQFLSLTGSGGESILNSAPQQFQLSLEKPVMRIVTRFNNFPVYRPSACFLRLYMRTVGESQWSEAMSYPITLHHTFYPS